MSNSFKADRLTPEETIPGADVWQPVRFVVGANPDPDIKSVTFELLSYKGGPDGVVSLFNRDRRMIPPVNVAPLLESNERAAELYSVLMLAAAEFGAIVQAAIVKQGGIKPGQPRVG